jgi:hypothetical protein
LDGKVAKFSEQDNDVDSVFSKKGVLRGSAAAGQDAAKIAKNAIAKAIDRKKHSKIRVVGKK